MNRARDIFLKVSLNELSLIKNLNEVCEKTTTPLYVQERYSATLTAMHLRRVQAQSYVTPPSLAGIICMGRMNCKTEALYGT